MENKKPHNPQAFPQEWIQNGTTDNWENGMTLRDYFASKAISGVMSGKYFGSQPLSEYAKTAFEIADAMLKQREL